MATNAQKIAEWRKEDPARALNVSALLEITGKANLYRADLYRADLHGADLYGANLYGANLRGANLRGANLHEANLREANLRGANLYEANLHEANLHEADLRGADLYGILSLSSPSGSGYMVPAADGWRITIGCWHEKTLDDLRDLVADKVEWPEATGVERERRRPVLAAILALCEAHAEYHVDKLEVAVKKWGGEMKPRVMTRLANHTKES